MIEAWLGSGGMGDVYRARDRQLNRQVALKVLPDVFALDPDRLDRFKREAQVLASLNHPNIASIHGFEESDGLQALALELVDGPTLADRIAHGPIPIDEALPIARQIAEGLEAAHEQGIIHRDLKPSNVAVRPDGTVKILDFGLAKVLQPDAVSTPDRTPSATIRARRLTPAAVILGTAAYMSPEQAKGTAGRQAQRHLGVRRGALRDARRAGARSRVTARRRSWLRSSPRSSIGMRCRCRRPPPFASLVARCLERDVKRRLRDIGEARIVLDNLSAAAVEGRRHASRCGFVSAWWRRPYRRRATRDCHRRSGCFRCVAAQTCAAARRDTIRVHASRWTGVLARHRTPLDCALAGRRAVGVFRRARRPVSPRHVAAGRDADPRDRRLCARDRASVFSGWSVDRVLHRSERSRELR